MAKVTIDTRRCKGCELCVESCPQGVIAMSKSLNDKGVHFAQPARLEDCTGCGLCAVMCPEVIIEVDREENPARHEGGLPRRMAGQIQPDIKA